MASYTSSNSFSFILTRILASLLITVFLNQGQILNAAESRYGFTDRLNTARALLVASRRIGAESVRFRVDHAESILNEAQEAKAQGDEARAKEKLDQAYRILKSGIQHSVNARTAQQSAPPPKKELDVDSTHRRLYLNLRSSTQALLLAAERINKESGGTSAEINSIKVAMDNSQRLFEAEHYALAYETLHLAYGHLQSAIGGMRDGKIIVRKIEFTDAQEEFLYEIERNNTYKLLIEFLVEKRKDDTDLAEHAKAAMVTAIEFRQRASRTAKKGAYKEAIKLMGKSTRELVKTIRMSGVSLPL